MYCPNCGTQVNQGAKFCPNCGNGFGNNVMQSVQPVNNVAPVGDNQHQFNQVNQIPNNQIKDNKGLISCIIGILSLLGNFILLFLGIGLAVIGLVLGVSCKQKDGKRTAGIILNILSIIISVVMFVLTFIGVLTENISQEFEGDGYTLHYSFKWSDGTINDKKALAYFMDDYYFLQIGKSAYNEITCNFDKESCRDDIRDEFYEMWSKTLNESSLELYDDSNEFEILKDDIYYLEFDYGKSEDDLRGKYYVLVSKEYNVVLSFCTKGEEDYLDEFNDDSLALLESIELEKNESDSKSEYEDVDDEDIDDEEDVTSEYDEDDIADYLESMSNWNRYSELRQGELGKFAYLDGGWRILGDSEQYWEFKSGQFYWYKSVNDLNDNYWNGSYTYYYGKTGLTMAGIDENRLDTIIENSNGTISSTDVVTVVMTPTKIISGGEDLSSTNIPADTQWTFVWIIIDHDDEGIEGQVLNVNNASTSYFVKIKD